MCIHGWGVCILGGCGVCIHGWRMYLGQKGNQDSTGEHATLCVAHESEAKRNNSPALVTSPFCAGEQSRSAEGVSNGEKRGSFFLRSNFFV
jgi:hypothetical protein